MKKPEFIFEKVLDFLSLLLYVVVLTGGETYEKYDKRTMARQYHSARGQPNELKGDEGTARIYGTASRGSRKELHGRAERNIREVPRLLGRVSKPCRSSHLRIRLPPRSKAHDGGAIGYKRITIQASEQNPMPIF